MRKLLKRDEVIAFEVERRGGEWWARAFVGRGWGSWRGLGVSVSAPDGAMRAALVVLKAEMERRIA